MISVAFTRRPQIDRPQEQASSVVRRTQPRPVASMVTTRSWRPTVGVARHTVKTAEATPAPKGRKLRVVTPPVGVILNPVGAAAWRWITVAPRATIQPCSQPPVPQLVPLDETHKVTGALRLIASLRASAALTTSSFASDRT